MFVAFCLYIVRHLLVVTVLNSPSARTGVWDNLAELGPTITSVSADPSWFVSVLWCQCPLEGSQYHVIFSYIAGGRFSELHHASSDTKFPRILRLLHRNSFASHYLRFTTWGRPGWIRHPVQGLILVQLLRPFSLIVRRTAHHELRCGEGRAWVCRV